MPSTPRERKFGNLNCRGLRVLPSSVSTGLAVGCGVFRRIALRHQGGANAATVIQIAGDATSTQLWYYLFLPR
jgi:hypothetical protein